MSSWSYWKAENVPYACGSLIAKYALQQYVKTLPRILPEVFPKAVSFCTGSVSGWPPDLILGDPWRVRWEMGSRTLVLTDASEVAKPKKRTPVLHL